MKAKNTCIKSEIITKNRMKVLVKKKLVDEKEK